MAGVRAFRPEDITAIVRLRRKIFHLTEQPSDAGLAAYYHRIFFENPWRDDAFPSFVYEDARGVQAGFLGSWRPDQHNGSDCVELSRADVGRAEPGQSQSCGAPRA